MKNKSLFNPFSHPIDSFFDSNKDGKLDTFETIFRDAHLKEMKENQDFQRPHQHNSDKKE